jgi:arylsulfatase A-like enzyme
VFMTIVDDPSGGAALLQCAHPFGEWTRKPESTKDDLSNGREYRGLRTRTHTYVRTLEGPWLLYDLETDPYQMSNIVAEQSQQALVRDLDSTLSVFLECGVQSSVC